MFGIDKKTIYVLIVIMIIGLIVRLWSINYGLPMIKYIDAEKTLGPSKKIAFNILNGKFDIDPKKYQYPTFFINIMALEYVIYGFFYGIINTRSGRYNTFKEAIHSLYTPAQKGYIYQAVPPVFHLMARLTSAIAGTLTILFTFLLGRAAFKDRRIGLVSALFIALMFFHVKDAKYPMTDATMCLMGTIGLYYIAQISINDRLKNYILAGAFLGLGISTKYFPIFFLIPYSILIANKYYEERKNKKSDSNLYKKILVGFLMAVIFFLVGTPIFLARSKNYLLKSTSQVKKQAGGKIGYTQSWYFDYLFNNFPINHEPLAMQGLWCVMGYPLLILLILGLFYSIYMVLTNKSKNRWIDIGLTITVILFYIAMAGEGKKRLIRYFYFLYPIFAVIAARFLTESIDLLYRKKGKNLLIITVSIIFVLPTAIRTVRFNYLRSHTDNRLIAGKWFEENIPYGSKVFTPILYHPIISSEKYDLGYYRGESMKEFDPSVELIKRIGFEYIITSSYDSMRFFSPDAIREKPEITLKWRNFFDSLDHKAKLIRHYENNWTNKPGPEIKIYKVI